MLCTVHQRVFLTIVACLVWQVKALDGTIKLSHDGPVILGGTITFKAELINDDGTKPSGKFKYSWKDDALEPHEYESETTTNTTSFYSVTYPAPKYHVGEYTMEVVVCKWIYFGVICVDYTSKRILFRVNGLLNGNLTIEQSNQTLKNNYVSSAESAKLFVKLRKGDLDYIKKTATSITTHWFIDCNIYNQTNDFTFYYNFTQPNSIHIIQAIVKATHDSPTTIAPTTTSTTLAPMNGTTPATANVETNFSNTTVSIASTTTTSTSTTTSTPSTTTTAINVSSNINTTGPILGNISFPFVCNSNIDPDPNVIYGYYHKEIKVREPISKIKVEGSTWIQPWKSLSLSITCNGTGPFQKCIEIHVGKYNVTGNETCGQNSEILNTCKFSLNHYFLDALEYTVLIILNNEVSTEIHPVGINIYKLTPKPQLSVIVVPVSCSLVAIVLIIFGIAYYVQSRSRFTVEVADFDFGQNNADMEYKTFTERLRDSFNNAVRPGNERLLGTRTPNYGCINNSSVTSQ